MRAYQKCRGVPVSGSLWGNVSMWKGEGLALYLEVTSKGRNGAQLMQEVTWMRDDRYT